MTKGERIRTLRESLGLLQVDVAKDIKVSKQTLYKYENDIVTNIPSDKIEALSKVLKCDPKYIMGWDEPEDHPFIYTDEMLDLELKFKQLSPENQKNTLQYIDFLLSNQND